MSCTLHILAMFNCPKHLEKRNLLKLHLKPRCGEGNLQRSIDTLNGQKVLAQFSSMAMLKVHSGVKRDVATSGSLSFLMAGCVFLIFRILEVKRRRGDYRSCNGEKLR